MAKKKNQICQTIHNQNHLSLKKSHSVALSGLELTMQTRLAWNSRDPPVSDGIKVCDTLPPFLN